MAAMEEASWVLTVESSWDASFGHQLMEETFLVQGREYQTDGVNCSSSYKQNKPFCRHQIFFNDQNNLPLFQKKMFNKRHLKPENVEDSEEDEDEDSFVEEDRIG